MRILHVDSGPEMRGGQWQVLYLLRGLRERGHQSRVLARGELLARLRDEGFETAPLGRWVSPWGDLIHAHDARAHSLAAVQRLFSRTPLVVSRRVAFPVRRGILSRWKYRAADHYIPISQFVAAKLIEAGIKSRAISVVYDGVPQPAPVGTTRGLVMAPATADPMKGSDLVCEACGIAGVAAVFSQNLAVDIGKASVFLYITRSEGLGSAALLAMAARVPVVASRVGGLPEAVIDGESGILVENTAREIANAIRRLLEDDQLRMRMGRAGEAIAMRRFSLASMVEGTLGVYEKVRA